MADGSIVIDTKVDTIGLAEGIAQISGGLSEMVLQAQLTMEAFGMAFTEGGLAVNDFLAGILAAVQAEGPALSAAMGMVAEQAVEALRAALEPGVSAEAGAAFIGGLAEGIEGSAGALAGAAQDAASGAVQSAGATMSSGQGRQIGASFGQGIAQGISSQMGAIASAARAAAQTALSAAMAELQIHSPSKAAFAMGVLFDEGFADGIAGAARMAGNSAERMARGALEALSAEHAGLADFAGAGHGRMAASATEDIRTDRQVTIERIEIRTEALSDMQDWAAAGKALGEEFARQARYRGAFVGRR